MGKRYLTTSVSAGSGWCQEQQLLGRFDTKIFFDENLDSKMSIQYKREGVLPTIAI